MSNINDFIIENGVLTGYTGPGGSVTIPDGVKVIRGGFCGPFSSNQQITEVYISDSVTEIRERAFEGCINLQKVRLPESLKTIGDSAFYNCRKLEQINIPDGVTTIGKSAFYECRELKDNHGLVIVRDTLYQCFGKWEKVKIPDGVTRIGISAFSWGCAVEEIHIPDSVTVIEHDAFNHQKTLKKITIPDSVTSIGENAFKECPGLQDENGMVIVKGTLYDYFGKSTVITVPDHVVQVAHRAFADFGTIEKIIFPNHPVEIGLSAMYGCTGLKQVIMHEDSLKQSENHGLMFGQNGKTIEMLLLRDGKEPLKTVGSFRKVYWTQTWSYKQDYLLPITMEDLPNYDRLVATGEFEGFKMNELGRLKAMLWRLEETDRPVSPEYRSMFIEFLAGKFTKVLKIAQEEDNAAYVRTLIDAGAVTEGNKKKIKNALKKSEMEEIRLLADDLDAAAADAEKREAEVFSANVEKKYIDRLKAVNAKAVLLKAGVNPVPQVLMADGKEFAPTEYVQLILAEYISQYKKKLYDLEPLAEELAAMLDRESLIEAITSLYEQTSSEAVQLMFLPVLFRYTDGAEAAKLYRKYKASKKTADAADGAILLNDSREAMMLADKAGLLGIYARMRGMTESYLQDTMMYDFGFEENGKKTYDLGVKVLEVSLNQDLTLGIFDVTKGKVIRSIPKKDVDPEVYAAVNADFSEMKKNIKKAAKNKSDRLFGEFLNAEDMEAARWKKVYLTNPLLRQIASLLVWEQDKKTFTLSSNDAICVDGSTYKISKAPICLAHPMEMQADEREAWQKYFTSRGIKQPFEQIWEPVVDETSIKKDRYKNCMIPYYRFLKQEKHGITVRDYDFHNEIEITLEDCNAVVDRIDWRRHDIDINDNFEVTSFGYGTFTRKVNHIAAYLDRVTIYGRILKDDVSVAEYLPRFTLAQISEFINAAAENNCTNVTALLLDYKARNFADFDPMEEFSLEL